MFGIQIDLSYTKHEFTVKNVIIGLLGCAVFLLLFIIFIYIGKIRDNDRKDASLQAHIEGRVIRKYIYPSKGDKPLIIVWIAPENKKKQVEINWTNPHIYDKIRVGDSIYSESGSDTFSIVRGDSVFIMPRMIYKRK